MLCVAPPTDESIEDERLLAQIIARQVSYDEARKVWLHWVQLIRTRLMCSQSISKGFFHAASSEGHILVQDGRDWLLCNETYMARFNWRTKSPAPGTPRFSSRQMDSILRDVLAGGTVQAAMQKVQSYPDS